MKMGSRWIDEMATMDAATFSFSVPASSFDSQAGVSLPVSISIFETKFS
jgi:hypothetical protein